MKNLSRRKFLIGAGATLALPTVASAQNLTYRDATVPYINFLKQTYRTPAGADIINNGKLGNVAQNVFSSVAEAIRDGEIDNLSGQEQFRIVGCHASDLEGMAQQIADQLHPSTGSHLSYKWPFFEKIRQDAASIYNNLRILGYNHDCPTVRSSMVRQFHVR